ncbi:flagellar hook-associated protein FlgK [Desulfurella sp.]|uniref:flagellar hook-associated protein FlgK n=1 Tax=Desulfurella sp. TaxID=1962857 RepID=UPI0025C40D04|nr:flagellar hook-associated protein FlgK [Desulfurella sp.]
MPSIFDGLYIGASGLNVAQNALNITGNNIANANTPGYTRESPNIVEKYPQMTQIGAFGLGAQVNSIISARNQLLDNTLNQQLSLQSYYQTLNDQLTQVENLFNEQNNTGLNTALNNFFNSWQSLSSNPDLATARQQVIQSGLTLSQTIQSTYNSLQQLQNNLYSQMTSYVNQINTLAKNIANINYEIKLATLAPNQTANTLVDQRNQLIQQLQKIANVNVFNTYAPSNQNQALSTSQEDLTILIGGLPIVSGTTYNKLTTKTTNGQNNNVFFQDSIGNLTDITKQISQGSLGAVIQMASKKLPDYMNSLNTLSNTIINQVNILHSGGSGLSAYIQTQGTYGIISSTNPINQSEQAGVNLPIKDGTLSVNVYDSNNKLVNTISIPIDANDSFETISNQFNSAFSQYGISMTLSGITQGNVQIISNDGYKFSFAGDTSNFLAAIGINTFFTGTNASNISVNPVIVNDQSKIAAGKSILPGDNSNALAIANLQTQNVMISNTQTINQYYNAFLGKIGSDVQANQNLLSAQNALVTQTQNLVSSQEGVSLDEEAANLIKYQMAYQASARFISVIDQITQSLINMVQ